MIWANLAVADVEQTAAVLFEACFRFLIEEISFNLRYH